MLTMPVADGTKLAGVRNADNEEVQSSRLVMGADGGTIVSATNPLPVSMDPKTLATSAKQDAIKSAIDALAPYLDGVEGLLTAIGNLLTTAVYYPATQPVSGTVSVPGVATQTTLAALLAVGTETYSLASNISLAAGASGPTVTVPRGGYWFYDAAFAGTSPSLKLQRLGADGASWIDVVTRTAAGSGDPVGIPNGAQLRVTNAGANAMTAVSAVLA